MVPCLLLSYLREYFSLHYAFNDKDVLQITLTILILAYLSLFFFVRYHFHTVYISLIFTILAKLICTVKHEIFAA